MIDTEDNPGLCLVHKNDLKGSREARKYEHTLILDPTMRRITFTDPKKFCSECGHNEAIFFVNPDYDDKFLKLCFICTRTTETE